LGTLNNGNLVVTAHINPGWDFLGYPDILDDTKYLKLTGNPCIFFKI
jgi:hypothetical protein